MINRHLSTGFGKLIWDILANLDRRAEMSESGDWMTGSLLILGPPGVGEMNQLGLRD